MSLFSGLDQFGLGKLEKMDVFEEEHKKEEGETAAAEPKVTEEDLLFDKSFVCPVCDEEFHSKMVRTGKVTCWYARNAVMPR